jgi:hypothetical protein
VRKRPRWSLIDEAYLRGQHLWLALLRGYRAAGPVPAGGVINRLGWWLAYQSLSSGSARCIQSLSVDGLTSRHASGGAIFAQQSGFPLMMKIVGMGLVPFPLG